MDAPELDRIRFVAGRFGSLQDLRGVVVGGAYVAAFIATVLTSGWPPGEDAVWITFGAALVVMVVVMLGLDRLYASRFGRTRGPSRISWRAYILPATMMLAIGVDRVAPPGTPGVFLLWCAALALAVAIRDFPYRAHHLIDVAAGVTASLVFGRVNAAQGFATAFAAGVAILGASMIVTGLLDHRILSTTLRRGTDVNHADAV